MDHARDEVLRRSRPVEKLVPAGIADPRRPALAGLGISAATGLIDGVGPALSLAVSMEKVESVGGGLTHVPLPGSSPLR